MNEIVVLKAIVCITLPLAICALICLANEIYRYRKPKYPCAECVNSVYTVDSLFLCKVSRDKISGRHELCENVRDTSICCSSARKCSESTDYCIEEDL